MAADERNQRAPRRDARPRPVADGADQPAHAFRQGRGSKICLVRDTLVVEGEDIGEIGPPFDHLHAEVAVGVGLPGTEFGFGPQRRIDQAPQQGVAESDEVADPVIEAVASRRVEDRELRRRAITGTDRLVRHHLPPYTLTATEPRSGWSGSFSTRRISSTASANSSGRST